MVQKSKTITETYCDVCGNVVTGIGWWEETNSWRGVVSQMYAPLDLCEKCVPAFDKVSEKWAYERYERKELTDEQKEQCIDDVRKHLKDW